MLKVRCVISTALYPGSLALTFGTLRRATVDVFALTKENSIAATSAPLMIFIPTDAVVVSCNCAA